MDVNSSYSAKQVLGKPNVYPRYGDSAGTWTQASGQLNTVHFIEVNLHSLRHCHFFSYLLIEKFFVK